MINNRQNGRRRGRGGGPRSPNNPPNPGNRQDNRSRGNAAQLHEKYKAMARDAQLSGDRVQTEYLLQFADHYFRVLNENRPRFEEQRPRRDDFTGYDDEDQDEAANAGQPQDEGEEQFEQRPERQPRYEHDQRPQREARPEREQGNGELRPRRERFRRDREEAQAEDQAEERISLEVLPPAIVPVAEAGEASKPPRRRARRPRPEDDAIAPAA
ncbi:MAG TPA: DUF4167 domain-containing protein [Allosphingosinicella sp.]|nr:DUF4167 domain-containing protein [Allosphingosinicella sp.]